MVILSQTNKNYISKTYNKIVSAVLSEEVGHYYKTLAFVQGCWYDNETKYECFRKELKLFLHEAKKFKDSVILYQNLPLWWVQIYLDNEVILYLRKKETLSEEHNGLYWCNESKMKQSQFHCTLLRDHQKMVV